MKKKYLCIGNQVRSQYDGDLHYISAHRVAELYKVNQQECIFIDDINREDLRSIKRENLITLEPSYHGDYSL